MIALREIQPVPTEDTYRDLVECAFDGVAVVSDGRIVEANPSFALMFEYDREEELVGIAVSELIRDATGIRQGGATFPIEVYATCGSTERQIYAVRDLTFRHRMAERLIESERRYRELLEVSHELICEHDLDGNLLSVNIAVARSLEISRDRLCTMNVRDVMDEADRPMFDRYLASIHRDGVAEGLLRVRSASGKSLIWHYQNALLHNGEQAVVRGLARDVTDREEALRTLRHSERQFRTIIENASDILGIVDPVGRIEYHSPSMERLLGIADLTGRLIFEFVHRDDLARTLAFFEAQAHPDATGRTIDFRMRQEDDSWRCLSVLATPVVRGGQTTSIVFNGRDVTDRILLEAQLQQANRVNSLGRLAATVAHEFNNVLMGIQPFADLMQRPGVSPSVIATGARHITNSVARGKRVAKDILRFTHPAEPSMKPVDVSAWWRQFLPEVQASTPNHIAVTWSISEAMTILADAAQLSQVFANVISNARDAMSHGGTLHISAHRPRPGETFEFGVVPEPEKFVHLSIEDNGMGIPKNVLPHVFDPLFTTKQNGGTGLGLAVAYQVVTRHGGHIFAESAPGAGTKFHIFMPATDIRPVPKREPGVTEPTCKRVLIIDDEPSIVEGLAELLRDRDMIVEVAENGRGGVRVAESFEPDLAIVDIRLPDIDGLEVARLLQERHPALRIVFASGHGATEALPLRPGRTAFLQKPFEVDALIRTMSALEQRGAN